MLKFGVPNKGGLAGPARQLLTEAGYECSGRDRQPIVWDRGRQVQFVYLRPRDIAVYVGRGVLDLGISGRDYVAETGAPADEILSLAFGGSAFFYAAPKAGPKSPEEFAGLTIATSFPRLVEADLRQRRVRAEVVHLDGAVEVSVDLGIADLVADVVQSGRTLAAAGLETIGAPLLRSEAVLLAAPGVAKARWQECLQRLQGVVLARTYVQLEYDIPASLLGQACRLTPGIEAPTVSPLRRADWVAVKVLEKRRGINELMDRLVALGAKGVFVSDIRTCRI